MSHTALEPASDTSLRPAFLRTLAYSDLFGAALSLPELHRYLAHPVVSEAELALAVEGAPPTMLTRRDGLVALPGRESLFASRARRRARSVRPWASARRWGRWIAALPFVRMVAVTGTLAVSNIGRRDDVDFLFVTEPGRLWLCRAGVVVLVRLARLFRVALCPNYFLAEDSLEQEDRDLYAARELIQMVPLYGEPVYRRLREANAWASDLFPNAGGPPPETAWNVLGALPSALKRALEWVLRARAFDALEAFEMRIRTRRLSRHIGPGANRARFDRTRCRCHFDDFGSDVLARYRASLRWLGLPDDLAELCRRRAPRHG